MAAGAVAWSAAIYVTGGFYFQIHGFRVSSRDHRDALLIALFSALAALGLKIRVSGWQAVRHDWELRMSPLIAIARALALRAIDLSRPGVRILRRHRPLFTAGPAVAIALAGIGLHVSGWSDARPLWLDEEMILLNIRDRRWTELVGLLWLGQSAPLGWMVVERAALVTLGAGEMAVRLVPAVFGIGTIVAALWIGRRWMGPLGSTLIVLLCTFGHWISHFTLEVKHYSADAFWALLLPALAVWATEADDGDTRARRFLVWWLVAAVSQTLSNGALLVLPGCALFLVASVWRRDGRRAALRFAASGLIWLAAFGLHYELSLRATHESKYLRETWASEVPAASMGIADRARWIGDRFEVLAYNPAGAERSASLWISAALGLMLGGRPALGLVFATAPLSAFVLAGLGLVPLYERFVLWMVPALYVGVALASDRAADIIRDAIRRRHWVRLLPATIVLVVAGLVCVDVYSRGKHDIDVGRPRVHKHSLDDRAAVRWLMARLQPGDAIVTSRLAWPAVWWYGGISVANADADGVVRHPAGIPLLEVSHAGGRECDHHRLREELEAHRRVLVYVGFRDVPPGFEYLLLHALDELGTIEAFAHFSDLGRAAVIDLSDSPQSELTLPIVSSRTVRESVPLRGCIAIRAVRRW